MKSDSVVFLYAVLLAVFLIVSLLPLAGVIRLPNPWFAAIFVLCAVFNAFMLGKTLGRRTQ